MKQIPFFKFYRSLDEIKTNIWTKHGEGSIHGIPESTLWEQDYTPNIGDIKYWEQVYQDPGNLGIFIAHDPLVELYMVVYYPIMGNELKNIETFYGKNASDSIRTLLSKLNIQLTPS